MPTVTPSAPPRPVILKPDFSGAAQSIETFTQRADFPQCLLDVHVDIRGFAGVVVELVKDSIVVRSSEGITQRFNANRLKTLCAPPDRSVPAPTPRAPERRKPAPEPKPVAAPVKPEAPPRVYIANPDFSTPVQKIDAFAGLSNFPQCVYGQHVEIPGCTGVVVEIIKGSLKIQSADGNLRSYNGMALKKIYGGG